jgi:hypothetical protein
MAFFTASSMSSFLFLRGLNPSVKWLAIASASMIGKHSHRAARRAGAAQISKILALFSAFIQSPSFVRQMTVFTPSLFLEKTCARW